MDNDKLKCISEIKFGYAKQLNPVRYFWLPALAVFITIFVFEFVFHGILMMPSYKATAALWRGEEQIQVLYYIGIIRQFGTALIVTALYRHIWFLKFLCGMRSFCKSGIMFGLKIGVLLGITQAGFYAYMPIPEDIVIAWFIGQIVLGLLIGIVLGLCYCNTEAKSSEQKDNA